MVWVCDLYFERRMNMQNCRMQTILRSMPTLHRIYSSRGFNTLLPSANKTIKTVRKSQGDIDLGKIQALAETLILQSIEDLWSKTNRKKSIEFFTGEGFSLCADIARMKVIDRLRLFRLLRQLDPKLFDSRHARSVGSIVNPQA